MDLMEKITPVIKAIVITTISKINRYIPLVEWNKPSKCPTNSGLVIKRYIRITSKEIISIEDTTTILISHPG